MTSPMRRTQRMRTALQYGGKLLDHPLDGGGAEDVDAAAERVGRFGQRAERRIAAARSAHDRDPLGIGDALVDRPLHAVGEIVLHLQSELAGRRVEERSEEHTSE